MLLGFSRGPESREWERAGQERLAEGGKARDDVHIVVCDRKGNFD